MAAKWKRYCRAPDLVVDESDIDVEFLGDRKHRVTVDEKDDAFLIRAFVARQAVVFSSFDLPLQVWEKNRATSLVGFRIDHKRRLIGEAWLPKAGITAEEFQLYVRAVAKECDRFEFLLTGRDAE